jgi:hypothetical protein
MSTSHRTSRGNKTAARKPAPETRAAAAAAAAAADANDTPIDIVLDDWSESAAKEQIAWEISATTVLLRSVEALREAQLEAARQAQEVHQQAAAQLKKAHGIGQLTAVQMELARADAEAAMQLMGKVGELTTKSALELWSESATGYVKMQNAAWSALVQFSKVQATLPQSAEVLEAEVEHITNPITSSPLVWPAQEATRQAMSLAASTWNDWLSWSGQVAGATVGESQRPH